MIIVDAFNVKTGGALVLLEYLLFELQKREINILLVTNEHSNRINVQAREVKTTKSSYLFERQRILEDYCRRYSVRSLLCFGNYPPIRRLPVKTVTYFHNSHLVKLKSGEPLYKKMILRFIANNTDFFVFQSERLRQKFAAFYSYDLRLTKVMPFYNQSYIRGIRSRNSDNNSKELAFIYNSLPYKHKNYETLFSAWNILNASGCDPILHVTIPKYFQQVRQEVPPLTNIINHGLMNHEELLTLMAQCSHCIFPSSEESLGLGLVEATELGLSVLVADEDYVDDVIIPSAKFPTYDAASCAQLVYEVVNGQKLSPTRLKKGNQIERLINLLLDV